MKNAANQFNFSDQHFDVLLNHALLSTKQFTVNEKTIETVAEHTFKTSYTNVLSDSQSNLFIERLANDFKKTKNRFWLNMFFAAILLSGTITAVLFSTNRTPENKIIATLLPQTIEQKNSVLEPLTSITAHELTSNPLPVTNPLVLLLNDSADESEMAQLINGKPKENNVPTRLHIPEAASFTYEDIPVLSESEKKQTEKDKLKMLKDIANPKKKIYTMIPQGTSTVNGVAHVVPAFYMKTAEVTNLEYRTFLNDILIQEKYDDYLAAVLIKGGWKAQGIPEFEDVYFSSLKYNDFPAVNMPRKGAELYCQWMTTSLSEAIKNKTVKSSDNSTNAFADFFLPTDVQWIHAARAGKDSLNIKYPWSYVGNNIQNLRGCFLCNFNYTTSKDHFSSLVGCPHQWIGKLPQGGFHRSVITTAGMAIDTLLTAPVSSYNPTDYGQYCMMGNVSEMVWTWSALGKGAARAMGGNWNSVDENVLIEAPEQYVGITEGSALIGFRPAWTWLLIIK
ncbi:hypothetical protein BH11BAC7_BH11BAC7_35790 [soil metagenome]